MVRALDDFRRAIAVVDGAIHRVVEDHDDVRSRLGRGFLRRIFDAGFHEDVECGPEPRLFDPELGHPFVFRGAQRHGLKLGKDAANRVQVLHDPGELFAQLLLLSSPVKIGPDLGELQRHLGEMPLLHLVHLDLLVHVRDHAAHAHDREHGTQERDSHENCESQPPRRAERDLHLPALRGIVKSSRSKTSPVRYSA